MKDKGWQKRIKRLIDMLVSLIMLVIFLPLWLLIAVLVKVTSRGPIFFLQERPGLHGNLFTVYKFRTMQPGSEKMVKGQEVMGNDARITAIGRFLRRSKLDEIPQLLNVLKGDMSLIGPRPERIASLNSYTAEIFKRLHMLPGMTGLAQVSGNIYLSLEDRYEFDVYYVENYHLLLDWKIVIRTIGVLLFGEAKYVHKGLVDLKQGTACRGQVSR